MKKTLLLFCLTMVSIRLAAQETDTITLCKYFWKTGEPMHGDGFALDEFIPGFPLIDGLLFFIDSNAHCLTLDFPEYDQPGGYTRCFEAYKFDDPLNGVTILDLLAISKHIIGVEPLVPSYSMIAADFNLSGSITTFDIVQCRKMLLGVGDPGTGNWRFFRETCQFPNPGNPFQGSNCPCIPSEEMHTWDGDTLDLIGVKSGDVDGDADPNGQYGGPPAYDSIVLVLPDMMPAPGVYTIPVIFEGNLDLGGIQVQLQLDTSLAQLDSITGAALALTSASWSSFPDGRFRVVEWSPSNPVVSQSILFYLHLTIGEAVQKNDLIKINNAGLLPLAVAADQQTPLSIGSKYSGSVAVEDPSKSNFLVSPASPNPFSDKTYIAFQVEQPELVRLRITDLTGRQLYFREIPLSAGEHRLEIPASVVAPGGIGFYQIQVGKHAVTGKILRH